MLTKDLINAKVVKGQLRPQFLLAEDFVSKSLAEEVLCFLAECRGERYGDVLKKGESEFGKRDKIARGLLNVAMNWAEQVDAKEFDAETRFEWFLAAEEVRAERVFTDVQSFREAVAARLSVNDTDLSNLLYSDIEENRIFEPNVSLTSTLLINEYNLNLVSFFLLTADQLVVQLKDTELESYRSLIRYIRFHELYAEAIPNKEGGFTLAISGASSVLGGANRVGRRLANFFGEILNASDWVMEVPTQFKSRKVTLRISATDRLVPRHRRTRSYVPEELKYFIERLKESVRGGWKVEVNTELINVGSGSPVLPDLRIVNETDRVCYLEFFHKWHGGALLDRMETVRKTGMKNYVVAVERSLIEKGRAKAKIGEFTNSGHFVLEYRDFPSVADVQKIVNSMP